MILRRILTAVCIVSILSLIGCGGGTDIISTDIISDEQIVTAFDIPADSRPYYERMQIRKPMPRNDGKPMLYPLLLFVFSEKDGGQRETCYIINEKGETVVPVGKYRNAEYVYDNNGVEKYLLCEKARMLDKKNPGKDVDFYNGWDIPGIENNVWDESMADEYRCTIAHYWEYDIIDLSGNLIYNFWCFKAYSAAYGPYVIIGQEKYDWTGVPADCIVYDVDKRSVYFTYPTRVFVPEPDLFIVENYTGDFSSDPMIYDPKTGKTKPVEDDIGNYWSFPEERYIVVGKHSWDEDDIRLLVAGRYYFDCNGTFIGYKNKSHEWLYRDIPEQTSVSGLDGSGRYYY